MSLKGHYIFEVSYALRQVSVDMETQGHLESSQGFFFFLDEKAMPFRFGANAAWVFIDEGFDEF